MKPVLSSPSHINIFCDRFDLNMLACSLLCFFLLANNLLFNELPVTNAANLCNYLSDSLNVKLFVLK